MAALRPISRLQCGARSQQGFTLIEILVAMSLLAVGLLAVALNTAQGLKSKIDTEVYSRAMQVTSFVTEPLGRAISINTETFINQLQSVSSGISHEGFTIEIKNAHDARDNSLLDSPTPLLTPPYTLVLDIQFQKDSNASLQFASTHVFVPTP